MAGGLDPPIHVPPHVRARTRLRTRARTHTPAHHAHMRTSHALCARQLDIFVKFDESEFVGAVIGLHRQESSLTIDVGISW